MKITICIGSSCHIKGSNEVVDEFQSLIQEKKLSDRITLAGAFCMGQCQKGVCVTVDGKFYSVSPDSARQFFEETVLPQLV